jgi:hypothetical protein
VIYVRQSTLAQLERNTESTARQYDLVERALALGWSRGAVQVIDADLGVSGSVLGQREGFESLVAEVALGQVGIVVALEVSRLARDNSAWYRLLDLAGACDTLVADADGVYHPGLFNDRLVLGMKGIMSEALCRYRHKASYADPVVMPTWRCWCRWCTCSVWCCRHNRRLFPGFFFDPRWRGEGRDDSPELGSGMWSAGAVCRGFPG